MTPRVKQSFSARVATVARIPPSSLGAIGEGHFLEIMTVRGAGGFVCYRPAVDFEGTDFLVKRRYGEASVAVQVKTRAYGDKYDNMPLAIEATNLPPEDPKLVVVLDYDLPRARLGPYCWVIPSAVFRQRSTLSKGRYEVTFSRKATSVDRWVDHRYNPADLAWVVGWYVDGRGAAPEARWMFPPPLAKRRRATPARRPHRGRPGVPRPSAWRPRSRRR